MTAIVANCEQVVKSEEEDCSVSSQLAEFLRLAPSSSWISYLVVADGKRRRRPKQNEVRLSPGQSAHPKLPSLAAAKQFTSVGFPSPHPYPAVPA